MRICQRCGAPLDDNVNFCTSCGCNLSEFVPNQVYQQPVQQLNPNNVETPEEKKAGNTLGIISLCLYFGSPVLSGIIAYLSSLANTSSYSSTNAFTSLISGLSGIASLTAWVLMIIGRVKYPKNKLCKVVMWIYIGLLIAGIVSVILLFAFCYITCMNMDTSGCN